MVLTYQSINYLLSYRDEAEKEFQECTEVAKSEIKAFHQKRLSEFRQSMLYYVEVIVIDGEHI